MDKLNFESLLGDAELEYDCPNCKSKIPFKLNQVGTIIKCPNCSTEIDLKKSDDFDETTESINESLDEFNRLFDEF